jgi:hypothetical protein
MDNFKVLLTVEDPCCQIADEVATEQYLGSPARRTGDFADLPTILPALDMAHSAVVEAGAPTVLSAVRVGDTRLFVEEGSLLDVAEVPGTTMDMLPSTAAGMPQATKAGMRQDAATGRRRSVAGTVRYSAKDVPQFATAHSHMD